MVLGDLCTQQVLQIVAKRFVAHTGISNDIAFNTGFGKRSNNGSLRLLVCLPVRDRLFLERLKLVQVAFDKGVSIIIVEDTPDNVVVQRCFVFVFVTIIGKRTLRLFMPDFKDDKTVEDTTVQIENHDRELFLGLFRRDNLPHLGLSLLLSVAIIALGAGIAYLFPKDAFQSVFILSISLLAILASLHPRVRSLKRTFEAGTYFILIFSVAVASQVSLKTLTDIDPTIFLFTTVATLGALLFHVLLSALFRLDTDTTLTTSISLICSPPFAPVMGSALHNKAVIGPGIAVGLFGYAIGTYLGFGIAHFLLTLA